MLTLVEERSAKSAQEIREKIAQLETLKADRQAIEVFITAAILLDQVSALMKVGRTIVDQTT